MILLIDFCTCAWWIPWLLSGALGLLLGWLIWGRLKSKIEDLESQNTKFSKKIVNLENELHECGASKTSLESEIALLQGRIREYEASSSRVALYEEDSTTTGKTEEIADKIDIGEDSTAPMEETEASDSSSKAESDNSVTPVEGVELASDVNALVSSTSITEEQPKTKDPGDKKRKNIFAGLKNDNLQIVEGIGPKMNEVLRDYGVQTWEDLGNKTHAELRAILDKANAKRYRIIDPSSWAEQAKLASEGKWDDLIALQKNLDSGRAAGAIGETDSKVEKLLIKMGVLKRWKQDDLTAIEGIGPKISGLLIEAGIDTWRTLANANVDKIQAVLDAAGKRYRLADPSSWPKQAEMAADGRWDDLEEYQDFLQGGK